MCQNLDLLIINSESKWKKVNSNNNKLQIENKETQWVSCMEYLGFQIDNKLTTFKEDFKYTKKKIRKNNIFFPCS